MAAADTTVIVFNVQPGKMDAFLDAYKAGPFAYLTGGGHVKAYTVSANADANKVFSHIVFTSPSSRDTAVTGPAWEAAVAPVRAFLAGPPDFSAAHNGYYFSS